MIPLQKAMQEEAKKYEKIYLWIEKHMPPSFFEEIAPEDIILITHALMSFDVQEYFSHIRLKHSALALCLDSPDADLRILEHFKKTGIKNYRTFISNAPPPFPGVTRPLRIAIILFTAFIEKEEEQEKIVDFQEILELVKERNPNISQTELQQFFQDSNPRFLRSLTKERLIIALDLYFRAKTRDTCQYEVLFNKEWEDNKEVPSLRIVLAWKHVSKHYFLYRLAKVVHRHHLSMKRAYATYINPYNKENILIMSLGLDGIHNKPAWEEANITDFLQELATFKYFPPEETIETTFVESGLVRGNVGNLIKTIVDFVHQGLVQVDMNMYSHFQVVEALCRHPELTVRITEAFEAKFHPEKHNIETFKQVRDALFATIDKLDTGNEMNDTRRKNVLRMALYFIEYTLKTNFYRNNKTAFSFRLDPAYLDQLPCKREEKFPELPFSIFFMKGEHFIGFHIRFRDLARGGLRTVFTQNLEQFFVERNNVFAECYNLAYTQQKKNKDIPEGGAKAIILLEPYERVIAEEEIYRKELEEADIAPDEIENRIKLFHQEQKQEHLYCAQRSYVESFVTLLNCEESGKLKAKHVVDYYQKPEYVYLGPDENMHNEMIVWISKYSKYYHYKPAGSFMSSKPGAGINHKEYGVTSFGVNVYMEEVLKYLNIDPKKDPFTIKMSGGPDGDVAGNQMLNLYRFYPKTAKLLATVDVSGTVYDPEGLDLEVLKNLFQEAKPIRFYPPEKLHEGGFLLDLRQKREESAYAQQTLCWRKEKGKVIEDWLSGSDMNSLFRHNVHQIRADIFIPGGGRPRTLNENNYKDYLNVSGEPSSKAIVEGANLYLTPAARRALEKLGVLIVKDSSANKGGVICSSFEVLCGLTLSEEEFIAEKPLLMPQILGLIAKRARDEATLLLRTHQDTGRYLTEISEMISERINTYTYQILDYLQDKILSSDPDDPLIQCLLNYCPPLLREKYQERVLHNIPDIHKKAMISCYIAFRIVYRRGLDWSPSIVDSLFIIASDPSIVGLDE